MKKLYGDAKKEALIKIICEKDDEIFQLKNIIENLPGDVYWKDKNGVYLNINSTGRKSFRNMGFPWQREDIVGKTDHNFLPKSVADQYRNNDLSVMESGQEILAEEPIKLPNGDTKVQISKKHPLYNDENEIVGIVGTTIDITDRVIAEEKLKTEKIKSEAASKAKSAFIANMSHDIRTPIAGMMGMVQDLSNLAEKIKAFQQASNPSLNCKDMIEQIRFVVERDSNMLLGGTHSLLNLCNDILETAKVEGNHGQSKEEDFEFRRLVGGVISLLSPVAQNQGLDLFMELEAGVPEVLWGHRLYLERVLLNLACNALKFTHDGFVKIFAKVVSTKEDNLTLQIIVEDTGMGIPEDKYETIFDQFSRLTASYEDNYEGSGLGLYTVRHYVNSMSGSIKVESVVGEGTKFILELPFKASDISPETLRSRSAQPKQQPAQQKKQPKPTLARSKSSVLVVEDNLALRLAIELALVRTGHKCDIAKNGAEAIEHAKSNKYDIIFMDIGLPDIDGMEVSKNIRTMDKDVPIIALTSHLMAKKWGDCCHAGMQELVTKPINPEMLEDILKRFL